MSADAATSALPASRPVAASSHVATVRSMEVVGITKVAEILGVSRQWADELSRTKGFPKPIDAAAPGRLWRRSAIERYAERRGSPLQRTP